MEEHFGEIIVPSEVIMERVKGQVKKSQRTIFPGYIIVQMDMNERHVVSRAEYAEGDRVSSDTEDEPDAPS